MRDRYPDFGPTFASEKLAELHGHRLSAETLRGWMIEDGLWRPKARRDVRAHPPSQRECVGDLVQIDGSPHDWFEARGPRCTLIVYVDDATRACPRKVTRNLTISFEGRTLPSRGERRGLPAAR